MYCISLLVTPESDEHLNSPKTVAPESNTKVTRTSELIARQRSFWSIKQILLVSNIDQLMLGSNELNVLFKKASQRPCLGLHLLQTLVSEPS